MEPQQASECSQAMLPACPTPIQIIKPIVDAIIETVRKEIVKRVLHSQMFLFARDAVLDATVSQLQMVFVPHDDGEIGNNQDWKLEDEPMPGDTDCWARHQLPCRHHVEPAPLSNPHLGIDGRYSKRKASSRRRFVPNRGHNSSQASTPSQSVVKGSDPRSFVLQESPLATLTTEVKLDAQFRQMWNDRVQLRARAQVALEAQRARDSEDEAQARTQMFEILGGDGIRMFDRDGRALTAELFAVDRLPRMQELPVYEIIGKDTSLIGESSAVLEAEPAATAQRLSRRAETAAPVPDAGSPTSQNSPSPKTDSRRLRRGAASAFEPQKFTDGFRRLDTCQPNIHETITLQEGVVLQSGGKTTPGPLPLRADNRIPWRAYMALSQPPIEDATEVPSPKVTGILSKRTGKDGTDNELAARAKSASFQPSDCAQAEETILHKPKPLHTATSVPEVVSSAQARVTKETPPSPPIRTWRPLSAVPKNLPAEPAPGLLASRHAASSAAAFVPLRGQWRCPRQHVALLGSSSCSNKLAPPLGATMGHGLMVTESTQESYYFPMAEANFGKVQVGRPLSRARSAGSSRRPQSAPSVGRGWFP